MPAWLVLAAVGLSAGAGCASGGESGISVGFGDPDQGIGDRPDAGAAPDRPRMTRTPTDPSPASPSEYGRVPHLDAGPAPVTPPPDDPVGHAELPPGGPSLGIPWGYPEPPAYTDWASCREQLDVVEADPPEVLFVVDRSGSTSQDLHGCYSSGIDEFGGLCDYQAPEKWTVMTEAMSEVMEGFGGMSIHFGLMLYPALASQCTAGSLTVAPGPATAADIEEELGKVSPGGGTPTRLSLAAAREVLGPRRGTGSRIVVLVTDGLPTCNPTPNDHDPVETVSAEVLALADLGIRTFVVGVGSGIGSDEDMLSALARAGGTARSGSGPAFYRVASPEALVSALDTIAGQALRCQLGLSLSPSSPAGLSVRVQGQVVERDPRHTDGWDYDAQQNSVVFYGPACDQLQTLGAASPDGRPEVEVRYPCSAAR